MSWLTDMAMKYPLGSFPRFPHQQRRADARRQRAMENSIATKQAQARHHLDCEKAVYDALAEFVPTISVLCEEGIPVLVDLKARMARIKRKHDAGERVYYAYLGETFQIFCRGTGLSPEVDKMSPEELKEFAENFGRTRWEESIRNGDGKIVFN